MGHFPSSYGYKYILSVVDYISKWVEAIPTTTCDAKIVLSFIRHNKFSRFGTPRAVISDEGSHFYNKLFTSLLSKYGVKHRKSLAYHLPMQWTSRSVKSRNQEDIRKNGELDKKRLSDQD